MRRCALALALAPLFGADAPAQERRVTLSVKPVLCITETRAESCELSIQVVWRSNSAGRYCLHSDLASEPIQCWTLAESGAIVEDRVVQETFTYWLTDGASDERLAEATLDVMTTESDDRRRHRQRRHVWDIL
jgi:hypothetical protein